MEWNPHSGFFPRAPVIVPPEVLLAAVRAFVGIHADPSHSDLDLLSWGRIVVAPGVVSRATAPFQRSLIRRIALRQLAHELRRPGPQDDDAAEA